MRPLAVIGVPANSAGRRDGVARAPEVLRETGLLEALERHADVRDLGDVDLPEPSAERDPVSHIIDPPGLAGAVTGTAAKVAEALRDERFPIVIGGDCPLLLGCLAAISSDLSGRLPGLLFVDGHEDAYPPDRSLTGEAADMELGLALGWSPPPPGLEAILPATAADRVSLLGPRDRDLLHSEGVTSVGKRVPIVEGTALAASKAGTIAALAIADIRSRAPGWWLHVDLDVLSTEALPAVDYLQAGGIGWPGLTDITEEALRDEAVLGWDFTIYNPDLDPEREHAARIVAYVEESVRLGFADDDADADTEPEGASES